MKLALLVAFILLSFGNSFAQIPVSTQIAILKAEDARRYDKTLEDLLKSPNAQVRARAALAAGRIGNEAAIPALSVLLKENQPPAVHVNSVFAMGEIESIEGADIVMLILRVDDTPAAIRGRAVEAAGKIVAANPKEGKSKELGAAILRVLSEEESKRAAPNTEVIRLGLTAALRARPTGADEVVRKFLAFTDANIVADALNTLTRLKAKNANRDARDLLSTSVHAIVRANAARLLGAAEDKEAVDLLIKAATTDTDSRVRVAAIRSLAALKDAKAAEPLLARGEALFEAYKKAKKPNFIPNEQNEFIEVATAIGRLLTNARDRRAVDLFEAYGKLDRGQSADVYVARIRVGRPDGVPSGPKPVLKDWREYVTLALVLGEMAVLEPIDDEVKQMKVEAPNVLAPIAKAFATTDPASEGKIIMAGPDTLQAYARFKTADLADVLRTALTSKDVQIRATAAGLIAELPSSKENVDALKAAFTKALLTDKIENDAQLAIMDTLFKLDKKEAVGSLLVALSAQDYLVRKKAFDLLADKELQTSSPGLPILLENARAKNKDQVLPYSPAFGTKLGQVLNTNADYLRAVSRKNGSVKAVLTTEKGTFTINLLPEDAPLTVDNFIKLARAKYFDGLEVHRVVPNFVIQDGDPRGDGNGGPGWSIRCEVNMVPYERGAVGMALSGKDTGGSQWFVTHSPQPHLDGGYTVFGKVNEIDMKVVDNIVRGDRILTVRIIGN